MSIDWKKVKKELISYHLTPLEYYCIDKQCALVKCYMNQVAEMMFIYIPSKLRVEMVPERGEKVYQIEDQEETTENDDYSKTEKIPDMTAIDKEQSESRYTELSRQYQKNISMEGSDEPIPRKIKRQTDRLRIPFARLSYDIAVQNGKWLCLSFDGENSLYVIKSYPLNARHFCFLMILPDLIDKSDVFSEQIAVIREQFYNIVHHATMSQFESIAADIPQYSVVMKTIQAKRLEYLHSIQECIALYEKTRQKEETIIKAYRDKMSAEQQSSRRSSIETDYQKQFEAIHKTKRELSDRGAEMIFRFHYNVLVLEECSFDNAVMLGRVKKNFERMRKIL